MNGYSKTRIGNKTYQTHRLKLNVSDKNIIVHHTDKNPKNNDLNNLQIMTKKEHIRIHKGWKIISGVWAKPCKKCGKLKPETDFYIKTKEVNGKDGISTHCKECTSEINNQKTQKK